MASGFRLVVAALRSGTIDQRFGTEHIVLGLRSARASGTLVFGDAGTPRAELRFEDGLIRKARSTLAAYLGGVLYELGRIDQATLNSSLAHVARVRQLHGSVLRALLAVDKDDIEAGLREQIERRLADLVSLPLGTPWKFHENEDRLEGFGGHDWPLVDPIGGLWRGLRDGARESLVQATTARAGDHRFVLSSAFAPHELGFDIAEIQLARSFVTPRRLVEPADRHTSKTAANLRHLLVVAGVLEVADAGRPVLNTLPGGMPRNFASEQQALEAVRALLAAGKQANARATALVSLSRFEDSVPLRIELAWVEANGDGSDTPAHVAKQLERFDQLAKEYPDSPDVYYYRGLLFRRQGMASFACRDLRKTLDCEPRHRAATLDLRLFNARRERGASVEDALGITTLNTAGKRVG